MNFTQRTVTSLLVMTLALGTLGLTGCGGGKKTTKVDTTESITSAGLDIQDFNEVATKVTRQMLNSDRVQRELKNAEDARTDDELPLILGRRFVNNTTRKINMVNYVVSPVSSVLINSGKADFVSQDADAQRISTGQMVLRGEQPELPEFVLTGVVDYLRTDDGRIKQSAFTFQMELIRTRGNRVIFKSIPEPIVKQETR